MFSQLCSGNPTIKWLPWRMRDQSSYLLINLSTILDNMFFDLQIYVPHMAIQQEGWQASAMAGCT